MMEENVIKEIINFTKKCDKEFASEIFSKENAIIAAKYTSFLNEFKKENNSNVIKALLQKLKFIMNQIDIYNYKKEDILDLASVNVTDYIINLVKEKHLIDPLLIARFAYIELSKVLYYDISYVKQNNVTNRKIMCETEVDLAKEKIFSYVLCSQWLQIYTYILKKFGITVIKQNRPGQDHVWGEIKLNDDYVLIVDATDYINSSIDLSNAKSMSPTVGFAVLPKEYSGIKLYDIFNDKNNMELAKKIIMYYELNREIDMSLGYINKKGYKIERIIRENELFNYPSNIATNVEDLNKYIDLTLNFFRNLKIPNNIDGYEIYAYYTKFIKKLPKNIAANISQQTIYVDSFSYKQDKMKRKFLHAPNEYLKYLEEIIYSRYYKYLSDDKSIDSGNLILENMKNGYFDELQVRDLIVKYEMKIAEINRRLNLYYAINKLHFYDPLTCDTLGIKLYEPMMGNKFFKNKEEFEEFKKLTLTNANKISNRLLNDIYNV